MPSPAPPPPSRRTTRRTTAGPVAALVGLAALPLLAGCEFGPPDPASQLIGCEAREQRHVLETSSHLDPSCIYTGGFEIATSGVTLDCQGAVIEGPPGTGLRGIEIVAPEASDLADVTVRNCRTRGFLNSVRIWREGFRDLERGLEYVNETRAIVLEDNWFRASRGVGIFVDGYVSDVAIERNLVSETGSSGIYLETGSRRNRVEGNALVDNGYRENGPGGQLFQVGDVDLWFWGVGREGISVDGSYENVIRDNAFLGNSAGGIFLYKNCGEFPESPRYFERRTPSDDNLIEGNFFRGGRNGIWVGSRMGENTLPMACTDPAYHEAPIVRVVRDYAADNVIRHNTFENVTHGIRVEDDGTRVEGNVFFADSPDHHAVIVGTPYRTEHLGEPVRDTVLAGNVSSIAGNPSPYRWVHGADNTLEFLNFADGQPSTMCEGEPVPRQPLIFVIAFAVAGPGGTAPPSTPDLTVPTLGALEPCL